MFSKLLCIVNISCYKRKKMHQSLLGVKGGGAKQPSEQPSLQHLTVTLKCNIFGPNLVKSTTNSTKTLGKCA